MISQYELTIEQRDEIWNSLSEEQRHFLHHILVRGRRTRFARQLARMKFQFIPEEVTLEELEDIIDEWDYIGFIDSGAVNPDTRCECGRALRYQHEVLHVPSNTRRYFGIEHLQLHTGIDAQAVHAIMKGFDVLDMEMNELLCKFRDGWRIEEHLFLPLPDKFEMPHDMQEHLNVGIPLLDRQLLRIRNRLNELEKQDRMKRLNTIIARQQDNRSLDTFTESLLTPSEQTEQHHHSEQEHEDLYSAAYGGEEQMQLSLFFDEMDAVNEAGHAQVEQANDEQYNIAGLMATPDKTGMTGFLGTAVSSTDPFFLSEQARQMIRQALPVGRISVKSVSEFLIERGFAPDKRFSTGKPDCYIAVAAFLDKLCADGECELTESSYEDRIYEVTR